MTTSLVKLSVTDVRLAVPAGAGVEAGMVTLSEESPPSRQLRIIVGPAEARAIHSAWTSTVPTRPSTWDLLVSVMAVLDARLDRVVITAVEEERHFFAAIEMDRGGTRTSLACRPSDAVALAMRAFGAGIFTHDHVMAAAGLLPDGSRPVAATAGAASEDAEVDPGGGAGTSFL